MATDTQSRVETAAPGTVLHGIAWKTYLQLRDNPLNHHTRMSYLDGTLILMSPEYLHDSSGWKLAMVVSQVTEALRIPCLGTATTTLRRKGVRPRKGSGKEPDYGFYFGAKGSGKEPDYGFYFGANDDRMRHRDDLDLDVDPPPDLAIEVDHKADSSKALKIYARLGVPEVWRYKPQTKALWFGRLAVDRYEPIERSLNLPRLTPSLVLQALDEAVRLREIDWRPWLRAWAVALPEPPAVA